MLSVLIVVVIGILLIGGCVLSYRWHREGFQNMARLLGFTEAEADRLLFRFLLVAVVVGLFAVLLAQSLR